MKKITKLLLAILIIGLLTACGKNTEKPVEEKPQETKKETKVEETKTEPEEKDEKKESEEKEEASKPVSVTDRHGRKVEFEKTPEKVICIGAGGLRLYSYVMGSEKIIGVDDMEKKPYNRPYSLANPKFSELPIIGPGGPKSQPDIENLSFAQPDVVFSTFGSSAEELDELQEKIGVPVVGIGLGREATFDPETYSSIENIGVIMGAEERAKEVNEYMQSLEKDLKNRSGSIEESPGVYVGCISYRGNHDLLWSRTNFNLLNVINAKNVVDGISEERNITLDKEKLLELNPEMIIIDLAGEELLKEDHAKDPDFYSALNAFKNNNAFAIIPYHSYETNIDTAMVNMYYLGSVVHPEGFKDINIAEKAAEIYNKLLGKDVYQELLDKYPAGHKPYKLGE